MKRRDFLRATAQGAVVVATGGTLWRASRQEVTEEPLRYEGVELVWDEDGEKATCFSRVVANTFRSRQDEIARNISRNNALLLKMRRMKA